MTKIYDQHRAAFASVSAWVILDRKGERVGTVALKYPRDGAGRLYAYVHLHGTEMVRGFAAGGGYDKASAAVGAAIMKIAAYTSEEDERYGDSYSKRRALFRKAVASMDGHHWDRCLEGVGFTVLQAV